MVETLSLHSCHFAKIFYGIRAPIENHAEQHFDFYKSGAPLSYENPKIRHPIREFSFVAFVYGSVLNLHCFLTCARSCIGSCKHDPLRGFDRAAVDMAPHYTFVCDLQTQGPSSSAICENNWWWRAPA